MIGTAQELIALAINLMRKGDRESALALLDAAQIVLSVERAEAINATTPADGR